MLEEAHKQTGNTTRKLFTLMFGCCVASGRSVGNFQPIYLLNTGEEIETVTVCDEAPFNTETSIITRAALYPCVERGLHFSQGAFNGE